MFYGSIPSEMQSIIVDIVREWDCEDIYVGCSGNFTVERCLYGETTARLHSNDVTVYSCLLGRFLAGQKMNATMKPSYNGVMRFTEKYFIFGTNDLLQKFKPYLIGRTQTTNRGVPLYVYSNTGKTRFVGPKQDTENLYIKRLSIGEEVGDNIELKILSNTAFQTLRSEYMNINIKPGQATLSVGVFVDDKLIGVYAFSGSPTLANWSSHIDTPSMYLLSDFPVEPTDYDRLAKLVLYAALSKESKLIAEKMARKRIKSLVTTAFSKNPSSMKYRGLFKVLNRKENKDSDNVANLDPSSAYYNQRYEINYGAKMGEWTLKEGLEMWKKKHSQKSGRKETE